MYNFLHRREDVGDVSLESVGVGSIGYLAIEALPSKEVREALKEINKTHYHERLYQGLLKVLST